MDTSNSLIQQRHVCQTCKKKYDCAPRLRRHEMIHTGERPFVCHICDEKCARKRTLKVHEIIHTSER